ncbi:hypothetical protein BV455_02426 [Parageobacillus caldoxylosilyticus]|nr:hypothetical protein BV455_02426 [Parageobacillus caldoxylosilyticus]BDG37249.1 hypothetical protein PcaKH15_31550 [Parageobacillus caldoxylosilyticus]BDG41040.1 hypothetical protein PcaKH16_31790 [Parageobacillus caldoxylosilyticus]BDG44791.1 hypothetical protein PcaKH35_31360 [Parageobacillus caldoxylosilyticus]
MTAMNTVNTTKERTLKLVSSDGEIVGEFNPDTQYIRNRKQDDFMKQNEKAKKEFEEFNKDAGKFIWSYPEKIRQLIKSEEFTKSDITMIFYLATFVNSAGYLSHDNGVKFSKKDIQEKLEISRNAFSKFFNKLIDHKILIPSGKNFMWNDEYNFYGSTKGKASPTMLVRSYVNQIRYLYEAKNRKGKKLYSAIKLYPVFALIPYLHHSTNIICKNPDVKNIEDIEYFNIKEIAELLDLNQTKKVSSGLSSLLLNGQTVFVKVECRNETYLKLNPRIFWRGTVAPDKKLVAEFDMIDNNRKKWK